MLNLDDRLVHFLQSPHAYMPASRPARPSARTIKHVPQTVPAWRPWRLCRSHSRAAVLNQGHQLLVLTCAGFGVIPDKQPADLTSRP
jgi:hypothetical protein